ncbi:MAG: hypothetical protein JXR84_10530 [Anaerolineae bacterium]|nr:hypothetical protein [Anaerolineae bacterium]
MEAKTDIWQFQAQLAEKLLAWSTGSMTGGIALLIFGDRFWRGFGSQCAGWGIIDALIAAFGLRSAQTKADAPDAHTPERQAHERTTLRRILWINFGLDVGYVAGGTALALTRGKRNRFLAGVGWGIVVQGGFLFFFDLFHALFLQK